MNDRNRDPADNPLQDFLDVQEHRYDPGYWYQQFDKKGRFHPFYNKVGSVSPFFRRIALFHVLAMLYFIPYFLLRQVIPHFGLICAALFAITFLVLNHRWLGTTVRERRGHQPDEQQRQKHHKHT